MKQRAVLGHHRDRERNHTVTGTVAAMLDVTAIEPVPPAWLLDTNTVHDDRSSDESPELYE